MRVLIVEDDLALQSQIKAQMTSSAFSVDTADDGEIGLYQATENPYDLAIIDLGLPKIDGIALVKQLRANGAAYPILILTARSAWQDKVAGLDAGADDYLTKPFHIEELIARANALIRRSVSQVTPIIDNGPFSLNTASMEVTVNGNPVSLSSYEYKVFQYLMLHQDQVISKTVLTEHIYDQDFDLDSNVIEVFVRRLRKKLDPDNQYKFIETLRGQGYKFRQF
ncbi:MAG: response regulator transcription factor [Thalassotalea sp.]